MIASATGNIIDNGRLQFTYDRSDQPTAITGTATGSFVYDAHNRRVKQMLGGETVYSVYSLAGKLILRDNITTGEVTEYVGLGGPTQLRLETVGGLTDLTFVHNDHLGSAALGTDASGNTVWWGTYTPFGEPLQDPTGNHDNEGFTGHIRDHATGLNYMQARYYDPVIGRFLSRDPVGFADRGPGYFNRYAYTFNDPVNFVDPTGMSAAAPTMSGALTRFGTRAAAAGITSQLDSPVPGPADAVAVGILVVSAGALAWDIGVVIVSSGESGDQQGVEPDNDHVSDSTTCANPVCEAPPTGTREDGRCDFCGGRSDNGEVQDGRNIHDGKTEEEAEADEERGESNEIDREND